MLMDERGERNVGFLDVWCAMTAHEGAWVLEPFRADERLGRASLSMVDTCMRLLCAHDVIACAPCRGHAESTMSTQPLASSLANHPSSCSFTEQSEI